LHLIVISIKENNCGRGETNVCKTGMGAEDR